MGAPLEIRLLGDLRVLRGGVDVALPSKRCRALLAWLVVTGRPHDPDGLCALLEDTSAGVRGALAELSRVVDDEGAPRIVADGGSVRFEPNGAVVDVWLVRRALAEGLDGQPDDALEALSELHRGSLLDGLDLPDLRDWHAWWIDERARARRDFAGLLAALVERHDGDPGVLVHAGRRALRVLAHAEAASLAARGLSRAGTLPEPVRVQRTIELYEVRLGAGRPGDVDAVAREVQALAERAIDQGAAEHARLAHHLQSHLRWAEGDQAEAWQRSLLAEIVRRTGDPRERVTALAEAARSLARVERDLERAEALLLEARALADGLGLDPFAVADALGLLRAHQGRYDEATAAFAHARALALRDGDRFAESRAVEHLAWLETQRERWDEVARLAVELDRAAAGADAAPAWTPPSASREVAGALSALARYALADDATALDVALVALRDAGAVDALTLALNRAARLDLARHRIRQARERAGEALSLATALGRPSERALALLALGRVALAEGARAEARRIALELAPMRSIGAWSRGLADAFLAELTRREDG